jgi:hypothetical protein
MKQGLILCGPSNLDLDKFDSVATFSIFIKLQYKNTNVDIVDLYAFNHLINPLDVQLEISKALESESIFNQNLKWAPLALIRISRRLLHYRQLKNRVTQWIKKNNIESIVVSSNKDSDLLTVLRFICNEEKLELSVEEGPCLFPSGLEPYMSAEALSGREFLLPDFLIKLIGYFYKLVGAKILYEPYHNFMPENQSAKIFTFGRTVLPLTQIKNYLFKKTTDPTPDFSIAKNSISKFSINTKCWSSFSFDEIVVINTALIFFFDKYSHAYLDALHIKLVKFFRSAKADRLILLDDRIVHCRLLAYSARVAGIHVDFLPHGVIYEASSAVGNSRFSPNRVLAWNRSSQAGFNRMGINATVISHPRNSIKYMPSRRLKSEIKLNRLLIFAPTTSSLQPDALERGLTEIFTATVKLNILEVDVRLHPSNKFVENAQKVAIKRIEDSLGISIRLTSTVIDAEILMLDYDLLIIGGITTAILEASRSNIPYVVFDAAIDDTSAFDEVKIPHAIDADTLIYAIRSFDDDRHAQTCKELTKSHLVGPHPFLAPLADVSRML